jgi:hypothetical protein
LACFLVVQAATSSIHATISSKEVHASNTQPNNKEKAHKHVGAY